MIQFPIGTKVVALIDIHDDASARRVPQHAKAGDIGTIMGYSFNDDIPTVDWREVGGGFYDSPWSDIRLMDENTKPSNGDS